MPVLISGVLKDGTGTPVQNCIIQLKAKRTSPTVVVKVTSSDMTGEDGSYHLQAEPGHYSVSLLREGCPPTLAGEIYVAPDSLPDTLNAFLGAPKDADLRPEAIKRFEHMAAVAACNAQASAAARDEAWQAAGDARELVENPVVIVPTAAELPDSPRGLYLVEADERKGGGPQIYYYPGSGRRFWFASVEDAEVEGTE
ncbi:prophage tail fiber N-terminal domain-containing protein [Salmonella enterica]|nr:prophage tail fiber N-terminal domain-containing protein [Salmonella enterica]